MWRSLLLPLTIAALCAASPADAGASSFSIVNGVDVDLSDLTIRRTGGREWRPLAATVPAGRAGAIAFSDPDCLFDIRATVAGGQPVLWTSVNLCDVKIVTLRRNAAGLLWVDYD